MDRKLLIWTDVNNHIPLSERFSIYYSNPSNNNSLDKGFIFQLAKRKIHVIFLKDLPKSVLTHFFFVLIIFLIFELMNDYSIGSLVYWIVYMI